MNDLSKTPATELVGEWKNPKGIHEVIRRFRKSTVPKTDMLIQNIETWTKSAERMELIAQELDRRCEMHGIYLELGKMSFRYYKTWAGRDNLGVFRQGEEFKIVGHGPLNAAEQHALEGWLLMKGGTGK